MKRLQIIFTAIFMLLTMIGCGQNDGAADEDNNIGVSEVISAGDGLTAAVHDIPNQLNFFSLEEFLYTHRAAREGAASERLINTATSIDLESLVELVLPNNLPGAYQFHYMTVYEQSIWFWFVPEQSLASEEARRSAIDRQQYFNLIIFRWTYEDLESWGLQSSMHGIMQQFDFTEEDLIDGRFLRERTETLLWAQGSELISLTLPRPPLETRDTAPLGAGIIGFTGNTIHDILPFTQTTTIDLLDEALVTALIGELYELTFDLGIESGSFAALNAATPISIPSGANISNFITMHHYERFQEFGFARDDFLGWYLDANFTTPLSNLLTTMPFQNTTLYARWQHAD